MALATAEGVAARGVEVVAEKLTRRFGAHVAVDALDLVIPANTTFGLLGANGAGKTTFIRMVTGFLLPSSGSVRVAGISPIERPVPNLRVALFDANNRVVQSTDAAPAKARLAPAGEMGFRVGLRDPSPLARRLEVTFIEGTLNPDGALPGDAKPAEPKPAEPAAAPPGAPQGTSKQ